MHARRYDPWAIYRYNPATDPDDIDAQRHELAMRPPHHLETPLYREPAMLASTTFGELHTSGSGLIDLVSAVERTMVRSAEEAMADRARSFFFARDSHPLLPSPASRMRDPRLRPIFTFQGDGNSPMTHVPRANRPPAYSTVRMEGRFLSDTPPEASEAVSRPPPPPPSGLVLGGSFPLLMLRSGHGLLMIVATIPIAPAPPQRRPSADVRVNDRDTSAPAA